MNNTDKELIATGQRMTETQLMENGLPYNLHNKSQGKYPRVLCVCTGGILRSATTAEVLSRDPYNCNTRACGIRAELSLVPVSSRLIEWADEIVCMESWHLDFLRNWTTKPIYCLGIEDAYKFRDPELIKLIGMRLDATHFRTELARMPVWKSNFCKAVTEGAPVK